MQQIGKYQLIERIGVGGFGEVFKGFDPYIKRHVAIKTCSSKSEEIRSRFFQEAEIAGGLSHRNITTVYDFGVEGELPYLIQEYLSGEDLDVKIRRKDYLPFAEKLYYLIQIARGLSEAHSKGIMHRDIKPANVRVLDDGTVKIMDFGIAKLAQQQTGLTQTGMTLGTAAYLSPEQIRGDSMDVRTDIFSFGVLAYELLAYERPFQGEQISAVLYQLLNNDPRPLQECWPEAPPEVVELLDCCLQKSPSRRYQNGSELLKALETLQRQGRQRSDIYRHVPDRSRPKGEPPTVLLDSGSNEPAPGDVRHAPPPRRGIDDLDLTGSSPVVEQEPALQRAATPPRGFVAQPPPRKNPTLMPTILIVLVLLAAAGGIGWWVGNRGTEEAITPPSQAETQEPEVKVEDVTQQGTARTDGAITPQGQSTPAEPQAENSAEPQAPPPPANGRILVNPPSWTDYMTVQVAGSKAWPLNRRRDFDLPPGTHTLRFSVEEGAYKAQKTLRAQVKSGQNRRIEPPIPQPAALTVRAALGNSQGQVFLRGKPLGASPLQRIVMEPAQYAMEIRPLSGDDGSPLIRNITLQPGKETIITFSLEKAELKSAAKDLK